MALTAPEITLLRSYVGEQITDAVLEERYARLEDLSLVVLESLRARLAQLQMDEANSVSVDGISINYGQQISYLRNAITDFIDVGGIDGVMVVTNGNYSRISPLVIKRR